MSDRKKRLVEADHAYLWHPFTQMRDWVKEEPIIVEEGSDCFIRDVDGRWYLDGVSSIWVNVHGHRKRELDEAIKAQLGRIAHSTLLGMSNPPAIELARRLKLLMDSSFGNDSLTRTFFSDNGSTAVEVALKMAFQYWKHKGVEGRHSFLSFRDAYHGDALGAVSVGGVDLFHRAFEPLLFKTFKAPAPHCYRCELGRGLGADCGLLCLKEVDTILRHNASEIAAVIIEPLIQCAGGMMRAPDGFLKGVKSLCRRHGVLLIADEVATGFGKTGRMFACEHEGVVPDIICLSKGLTGGYMPLAATMAGEEIYSAFLGEYAEVKTFFHGHSYTGNPLGCACALACLDVFEREETLEGLGPKIELFSDRLSGLLSLQHVGDVRNAGFMAGVELVRDRETREPYGWEERMGWAVALKALEEGVFIRPLGNVLVVMPPLAISDGNIERLFEVLRKAIKAATGSD